MCGSNITARLGKQVYIRKEYHDQMCIRDRCSLIRKCTNRSGTERLSVTENNLTVSMGFTLILTGKV